MKWQAISEAEIDDEIKAACERMTVAQRRLWETIRIKPEKWQQPPYGDVGGGFWVVAIIGRTVIWYNDIEDGFNRSSYTIYGMIDQYWCNQDQLEWTVQHLLNIIESGCDSGFYRCSPQPLI